MPQLQRILMLGALSPFLLLCTQSCGSRSQVESELPCAAQASTQGTDAPCDIYDAAKTPCVAAFSTIRALYHSYDGPLYEVTRKSDKTTAKISVLSDGYADAAEQDKFCAKTTCAITEIFDQSPHHNDLTIAPPGASRKGPGPDGEDLPAIASSLPITAGGHKVYGLYISAGMGYRNNHARDTAVNAEPEGVYMVASGEHVNTGCCFDFGNAETNNHDDGPGHMSAMNLRLNAAGALGVGFDLEGGIYPYPPFVVSPGLPFITAMGVSDGQHNYAVSWGDAQGKCLTSSGLIPLPSKLYTPLRQEGAIILGIGGDNSNWGVGSFFEGAMTAGAPSNATMNAVQANVVSVGYTAANP